MYDLRAGYLRTRNLGDENERRIWYKYLEIYRNQIRYTIKKLQMGDFD